MEASLMARVPWRKTAPLLKALNLCPLILLLLSVIVSAQTQLPTGSHGSITGKVLDQNRAAVAGAKVVAQAGGLPSGLSTMTDEQGEFSLSLAPGAYVLRI